MASYWLSLWDGDTPPSRKAIAPADIKPLLPGVIFFQFNPDRSVSVRMAGTDFCTLLNRELTGTDWLSVTPHGDRDMRLHVFSRIAQGAIGFNRWRFPRRLFGTVACEKLLLPLCADDGEPAILGFVDWSELRMSMAAPPSLSTIPPPAVAGSIIE